MDFVSVINILAPKCCADSGVVKETFQSRNFDCCEINAPQLMQGYYLSWVFF